MASHFRNTFIFIVLFVSCCEGSEKQGIAAGGRYYRCGDFEAYGKVNWWYSWGSKAFPDFNCTELPRYRVSHVPMQWGKGSIRDLTVPKDAQALLGFNEPNHEKQANMWPQEAAELWPLLEQAAPGVPLVSPATAGCGFPPPKCLGNDTEWLDQFFKACKGCRVDYLATHEYSCNANKTMQKLELLYKRYGKKIWLTEFACPNTVSVDRELSFMKEIIPRLEKAEFVHRYSWFASRVISPSGFVTNASSLLQANQSKLTNLGSLYISYNDEQETFIGRFQTMLAYLQEKLRPFLDFFHSLAQR